MSVEELGRYRIVREVGRGAMGVVYLAQDPRLNRQVAIKTLELTVDDPQQREFLRGRLLRDAQAAAALSHPNIVAVFDVIEEPNSAYVVMEYVDGESLASRLRRIGRPEPAATMRVLREMASALDYTHERGVIHRDIKPGNVMIDAQGTAKIMDFGIARIADTRTNTPTGMVMGTIHYMAPEQIKGEPLDGRCDQFALGAVAYEMLTGGTMFGAQSLATLAYKIVNEEPPPMRSMNANLPEAVDTVIRRALAKQPAQRYATCGEFVKALDAAFAGPAAAPGADRDAPTLTMRLASGELAAPSAARATGATAVTAATAASAPAAAAPPAEGHTRVWMAIAAVVVLAVAAGVVVWRPWAAPQPAQPVKSSEAVSALPSAAEAPPARETETARKTTARPVEADRASAKPAVTKPPSPPPQPEGPPPIASPETDPEPAAPEEENAAGPAVEAWKQGNGLETQGDHAGAIAAYTKALSIKPRYAAAYTNRGLARFRSGDFAGAVQDYSRAIDILPKLARIYMLRGNARVRLQQLDPAMSDFSRAIELNPQLGPAWGARGALYASQTKYKRALSDLDEAVRLAPRQEIWHKNRASVRRALGDAAGANADEEQARKLMAHKGAGGSAGK